MAFNLPMVSLYVLLFFFVLSRIENTSPKTHLERVLHDVAQFPFAVDHHIQLVKLYFEGGEVIKAKKELQIASEISQYVDVSDVLGIQAVVDATIVELSTVQTRKQQLFQYWETAVASHPEYRDAWVQLYYLALNQHNESLARTFYEKLVTLDPIYTRTLNAQLQIH